MGVAHRAARRAARSRRSPTTIRAACRCAISCARLRALRRRYHDHRDDAMWATSAAPGCGRSPRRPRGPAARGRAAARRLPLSDPRHARMARRRTSGRRWGCGIRSATASRTASACLPADARCLARDALSRCSARAARLSTRSALRACASAAASVARAVSVRRRFRRADSLFQPMSRLSSERATRRSSSMVAVGSASGASWNSRNVDATIRPRP